MDVFSSHINSHTTVDDWVIISRIVIDVRVEIEIANYVRWAGIIRESWSEALMEDPRDHRRLVFFFVGIVCICILSLYGVRIFCSNGLCK